MTCSVQAQKVAIVLSGGGSKGVAHVGVLKALEENNIPIDCIAGTSMGAIVGGMYASGYSPEEIEQFIEADNFQDWAKGDVDPKYTYYFKKNEPDASWIDVLFDYSRTDGKMKSGLPTNIISPHVIDFAFMEYYSAASAVSDYNFDSLMIPFRCVASDIENKEAVVFRSGQLSSAVRASMTFPFYFKPIRIDGKLYWDGGIYNNFPINVAEEDFNPDIIIASKTASNFSLPDEDDLMSQIQNLIVTKTDYTLPENAILIDNDIPDYNVVDFSKAAETIEIGYNTALAKIPEIKDRIIRKVYPEEIEAKRKQFEAEMPVMVIDTIIVKGLNKQQSKYVSTLLKSKSEYLTIDKLKEEYFRLLSDENIKQVYPTLIYYPDRKSFGLNLDIKRAERYSVSFGGNVSSSAAIAAFLGFDYRFLGRHAVSVSANGYFGRFYSSAHAHVRTDFSARIPFYMEALFTYNHKDYFRSSTYFFEDKDPSFLIQNESFGGLSFGLPATNIGKVSNSYYYGYTKDEYYQTNSFSRADTADRTYFDFFVGDLSFEMNSLNKKQFPDRGTRLLLSFKYITGDEKTIGGSTSESPGTEYHAAHKWYQFRFQYDNYFRKFGFFTLGIYGELLLSNQPAFENYTATMLQTPAFDVLPEMKTLYLPNYRAQNYAALGLKGIFNVYKQLDIRAEGYLFQPYAEWEQNSNGDVDKKGELSKRSIIGAATIVYHSPLGPISLAFNYFDRADDNFTILFNIGYILFNKGALD